MDGRLRMTSAAPCGAASAAVGDGDDLEVVAVRALPVQPAATVVGVDLALTGMERVGPVGPALVDDAVLGGVELGLTHEERVVLPVRCAVVVGEVQRDAVGAGEDAEGSERG